jgi:general secretion pathway protein H
MIEILIVIAIIGLAVGLVAFSFGSGRLAETQRRTDQVAATIRFGFDKARVTGTHLRLAIDLDKGTFTLQEAPSAMYLPATDREGKIYTLDAEKLKEREERDKRAEESYNASIASKIVPGGAPSASASGTGGGMGGLFGMLGGAMGAGMTPTPKQVPRRRPPLYAAFEDPGTISVLRAPIKLPEGAKIESVRTDSDPAPLTKGQTALFFYPSGRTQKAHIQIVDGPTETAYTIVVEPLTGRVTVEPGRKPLELPAEVLAGEDDLGRERKRRSFNQ